MNIVKMNLIIAGFLLALPFARAQACDPDFPGQILHACGNPDLIQFERDAVTTWLQLHRLPDSNTEISFLYQYARADVRDEIRALMFDNLLRIIQEDPSARTPHEQALYTWFKGVIDPLELAQYQDAAADASLWKLDPCSWKPDPEVAADYGLDYNVTAYCSGDPLITDFTVLQVPSQSYFLAAAMKKTYGNAVTGVPYGSATQESLQTQAYKMFGYAAAPAAGLSAASSLATYQFFINNHTGGMVTRAMNLRSSASKTASIMARSVGRTFDGTKPAVVADAATEEEIAEEMSDLASDFAAAPAAFVLMGIEIGVEAGFNFISAEEALNEVNQLSGFPQMFQNSGGANLKDFLANDTGMYQLSAAFASETLPDTPSTETLPDHRDGVDAYFVLKNPTTGAITETQTLTYKDLAGTTWNLQTYDGFFLKSGTLSDGSTVHSIAPTLTTTDSRGITWDVDWTGPAFLLTMHPPAGLDSLIQLGIQLLYCPADPTSGLSDAALVQTGLCSSYVASSFPLPDGTLVRMGQAPSFTGDPIAGFAAGSSFSVNITAAGIPAADIATDGAVPSGVMVSGGKNGAPLTLSGSGLGKGTYTIPLQATNGTGSATENFTLVMGTVPQFVSPAQFTDHGGTPETFTIRAAGDTPMTFSLGSGFKLPPGYTFHDNKNGTATISGTDPGNANGNSCSTQACVFGGTVLATNISGQTSQNLTIPYVFWPPALLADAYNGHPTTTFRAGVGNSFTIETNGAAAPSDTVVADFGPPVTITEGSTLPGWLQFKDNGDGTATFSGQPPETATSYDVSASIALDKAGDTPSVYPVTIHVSAAPVFLDTGNQLRTKCTAGYMCGLSVHTNMVGGTFTLANGAPGTILQTVNQGVGELFYQTTAGGAYPITVKASNSYGEAAQDYTLYVLQPPGFPTVPGGQLDIWLMAKVPASYSIPTTGYPHDVGVNVGIDPGHFEQYLPEMKLGEEGKLPPGISFTDRTSAGIPTGTGLFSGTPDPFGAGRDYQVLLSADNGLKASLPITIHVRAAGDVNNDGQVNCGDFNTFRAALGTYAGQPNYNVLADINGDGAVNVKDLFLVARYLPRGCPIQ